MSVRRCIPWPDKRLRSAAAPLEAITAEIRALWDDMVDTMEAMPGVGLAAVQIGVMQRLAVVDASETRGQAVRMANPVVRHAGETLCTHEEASPCLPGVSARVTRPCAVTVTYLDETGAPAERTFAGLWAVSVQHQIDHLAGRLYVHRLSRVRRDMLLKRAARG